MTTSVTKYIGSSYSWFCKNFSQFSLCFAVLFFSFCINFQLETNTKFLQNSIAIFTFRQAHVSFCKRSQCSSYKKFMDLVPLSKFLLFFRWNFRNLKNHQKKLFLKQSSFLSFWGFIRALNKFDNGLKTKVSKRLDEDQSTATLRMRGSSS